MFAWFCCAPAKTENKKRINTERKSRGTNELQDRRWNRLDRLSNWLANCHKVDNLEAGEREVHGMVTSTGADAKLVAH